MAGIEQLFIKIFCLTKLPLSYLGARENMFFLGAFFVYAHWLTPSLEYRRQKIIQITHHSIFLWVPRSLANLPFFSPSFRVFLVLHTISRIFSYTQWIKQGQVCLPHLPKSGSPYDSVFKIRKSHTKTDLLPFLKY